MSRQINTITVWELRELLEDQDQDALVAFSSDYGDYCHTQQVLKIKGDAEVRHIYESAYSHSGFAVVKDDDDVKEGQQKVIIIS